jgi:hypothetical protein
MTRTEGFFEGAEGRPQGGDVMKVSVLIPAYNCASTICATLDSVLLQTEPPDEIVVMDDGSTDETASILAEYKPVVTVLSQPNRGVASARNALCRYAEGDLFAFLDHDDIWHARYLERQRKLIQKYPDAVAFFTGHVNFYRGTRYEWQEDPAISFDGDEIISPLDFCRRFNQETGFFGCMSFCCIPRWVFTQLGDEPFPEAITGADDFHLFNSLPLIGPAACTNAELVAYRCTSAGQSADLLRVLPPSVAALEDLEESFVTAQPGLLRVFRAAFASRRRGLAKTLMGAGRIAEARKQLRHSLLNSTQPASITKSLALYLLTYVPAALQPAWPGRYRAMQQD